MAHKLRLSGGFDVRKIAKQAPGFVGADLASLIKEAAVLAIAHLTAPVKAGVDAVLKEVVIFAFKVSWPL
ncbi:hypothetical protein WJX72_006823 [[Myrmecia] bisecta]|uniref:AAA ATPase AAA+ lid domain-containing protein n=1 Tax=[Myrmecia] bisecta TaxID=41462 RepID=A0AAW1Q2Y2_9CHLO